MVSSLRGSQSNALSNSTIRFLESDSDDDHTWLMRSIVALIALFFVVSLYQFCFSRFRKSYVGTRTATPNTATNETAQKVFTLSEGQRRAVLEAIYAENSKPAKEVVTPRRNKRQDKLMSKSDSHSDEGIPIILQIPSISFKDSFDKGASNRDITCIQLSLSSDSVLYVHQTEDPDGPDSAEVTVGLTSLPDFIRWALTPRSVDPCAAEAAAEGIAASVEVHDLFCHPQDVGQATMCDETIDGSMASQSVGDRVHQVSAVADLSLGDTCSTPVDEVVLERELHAPPVESSYPNQAQAAESAPIETCEALPVSSPTSFAAQASEFEYEDDVSCATGDNMCPICLGGYVTKDILIMSKHCTHVFHKDCIMEWLQKNDDCPICRTSMITEAEVNQAASSLVGKTRMYRAVASMNAAQRRPLAPSRRSMEVQRSPLQTHVTPLSGTVLRSVSISFT